MKKVLLLAVAFTMLVSVGSAFAEEYTGKTMNMKLATEDLEGDLMTTWSHKFSDAMKDWSGGKLNIAVHPYGTIGDTRDINELAQLGVIEFVVTDYAWISSFVPEAQVLGLHYLWPKDRAPEVLQWIVQNGKFMDVLEKAFRRNDLVPLGLIWEDWMWITSRKPVLKPEDLNSLKLRVMSSKVLVDQYKNYGAAPTPMSFGEVYGGLQMGLIDAQMNPIFADYSMKFFEVTDYFTLTYNEAYLGIPTINMAVFDSLPKAAQDKMRQFWTDATVESAQWLMDKNAGDMAKIKKEKPGIVWTEFTTEQVESMKKTAKTFYPNFKDIGGPDAQAALDALLADIENAKKALGM